jgi:hypothetical protein
LEREEEKVDILREQALGIKDAKQRATFLQEKITDLSIQSEKLRLLKFHTI